jgi:hypothetical protein
MNGNFKTYLQKTPSQKEKISGFVKSFFSFCERKDFEAMLEKANGGRRSEVLVEELAIHGVLRSLSDRMFASTLRRIKVEGAVKQLEEDCYGQSVLALLQAVKRTDITLSPGEVAMYLCYWMEQAIKRRCQKEARYQAQIIDPESLKIDMDGEAPSMDVIIDIVAAKDEHAHNEEKPKPERQESKTEPYAAKGCYSMLETLFSGSIEDQPEEE